MRRIVTFRGLVFFDPLSVMWKFCFYCLVNSVFTGIVTWRARGLRGEGELGTCNGRSVVAADTLTEISLEPYCTAFTPPPLGNVKNNYI